MADGSQGVRRTIRPLDVEQARALLQAAKSHRLEALFAAALACGLRLGEATGVAWKDVDLGDRRDPDHSAIAGGGEALQGLKTVNSRRVLVLPAVCLTALRAHRTKQRRDRLKAGSRWVDSGLVFTTYRTYRDRKGSTSELRITADLYTHLQKQSAAKTATIMDAVLDA